MSFEFAKAALGKVSLSCYTYKKLNAFSSKIEIVPSRTSALWNEIIAIKARSDGHEQSKWVKEASPRSPRMLR